MDIDSRPVDPMTLDDKKIVPQFHDDEDEQHVKERLSSTQWVTRISIFAILVAIAQIVLAIIHLTNHSLHLAIVLLAFGIVFLGGAILAINWSRKATKAYKASAELFQPRVNDGLSRTVFVLGLVFAAAAVALFINCFMQKEYSTDYVVAQNTNPDTWNARYGDRTAEKISDLFRNFLLSQAGFMGFFIIYFTFVGITAFRCLKWDNQAMSHLVFLGNVLLLGFGLAVVYYANHAYGYGDYPQVRAHFPVWNIKALFFLGIFASFIGLVGFLIDHRSWRVGFFLLTFLILTLLVLMINFTGLAFRHTNGVYKYYKGIPNLDTCSTRLYLTHASELENYGCPSKYLPADQCGSSERVSKWEPSKAANTAAAASASYSLTLESFVEDLQFVADTPTSYCLNTHCCGLQGQVYSKEFLILSNFALSIILSGCLVSIACYYFWYVKWIDTSRDKKKDFYWLGVMILIIAGFLALWVLWEEPYVQEKVGENGKHI